MRPTTSCSRASGAWQDHACHGGRQRAGREHPHDERAGHRAHGRLGCDPHEPRGGRRSVHRRDSSPEPHGRGGALSRARGLRARHRGGEGAGRAHRIRARLCLASRSSVRRRAPGLLTGPLRDRFGIAFRLQYYTPEELAAIVVRSGCHPGRSPSARTARSRLPAVAAELRVWRTACSSACATGHR